MSGKDVPIDPAGRLAKVREFERRRELFGAVADLPCPDRIAWLRQYVRRHLFPHTPRLREARRWLAALEGERSGGDGRAA